MEPILISCAGMDVHEKKVDVCMLMGLLINLLNSRSGHSQP